jgi:hypothetical protein
MAIFGADDQNVQISTGNVRTTIDAFDSTKPNNGAKNPLGSVFYNATATASLAFGNPEKFRYVRYNSTTNANWAAAPAPVYWVDAAMTTVTGTMSESLTGDINSVAGYVMPNTTDFPGSLTGAQLATKANGNYVWMQVWGNIVGAIAPASTAHGDAMIGKSGNFVNDRTAQGTAPTGRVLAWSQGAVASGVANQWIVIEGS